LLKLTLHDIADKAVTVIMRLFCQNSQVVMVEVNSTIMFNFKY